MATPSSSFQSAAPPVKNNVKGAAWMLLSGVAFTGYLTLAKQLGSQFDPGALAFLRSIIALLVTIPFMIRQGPGVFRTDRPGMILARSVAGTLGFLLSLYALSDMFDLALSQMSAISFSRTLFVVVMAAIVLGEPVGPRRWIATGIGFVGVIIMVRPEGGIDGGSLIALASSASFALAIILVKSLSATHTPLTLLTLANIVSSLLLLPLAIWQWQTPTPVQWGLITAMAITGVIAQFCYITAMRIGDASFQAPMDYLRLPMTAAVDVVVFHLVPGLSLWIGATVIVASTLYITLREAMLKRQRVPRDISGP